LGSGLIPESRRLPGGESCSYVAAAAAKPVSATTADAASDAALEKRLTNSGYKPKNEQDVIEHIQKIDGYLEGK
jgi:hypothetical protein